MKYETLIIDGPYLFHRAYTAPYELSTSKGINSKAIHNFMISLLAVYKKFQPNKTVVCWESHGTPSWRRQLYPQYKPSGTIEGDFLDQINDTRLLLHLLQIRQLYAPTNEADDVIATLCAKYTDEKSTVIYTIDKDMMQLVSDKEPPIHIWDGKNILTEIDVHNKFGVFPYQICDYLSLVGDKVDNIPGVNKIGPKKAVSLLEKYDSLESISLEDLPEKEVSLMEAIRAKKLVSLNYNAQIKKLYSNHNIDRNIDDILDKYELVSIQKNITKYTEIGEESWF